MKLQYVAPETLSPNVHVLEIFPVNSDTRAALTESIQERGILTPILVGTDGMIIDGHTRYLIVCDLNEAATKSNKEKPFPTVPINVIDEIEGDSDNGISLAIQTQAARRNLNASERRQLAMRVILTHTRWSDRRIAMTVGMSPDTVGIIRAEMQTAGEVEAVTERESKTGTTVKTKSTRVVSSETKLLPKALLSLPTVTEVQLSAKEWTKDELAAMDAWGALLLAVARQPKPDATAGLEKPPAATPAPAKGKKATAKA